MAGTYPDVPGPRMAYDRNGTAGFYHDGSHTPTPLTGAQLVSLNDEAKVNDFVVPTTGWVTPTAFFLCLLFPQLRDIVAFGARFGTQGNYVLQTSTNSTNGLDGTWTNASGSIPNTAFDPSSPSYRTTYQIQSIPGVSAVRFNVTGLNTGDTTAYGVHLYGGISSGQTLDRLAFVDMFSNPLQGAALDQGDVVQSSSGDIEFQLMNASPTRTATNVSVFTETNTDTTPSVPAQYLLSTDGINFYGTVSIASLTPNQTQHIWLRRITPAAAVIGAWSPRVVARPGAWN